MQSNNIFVSEYFILIRIELYKDLQYQWIKKIIVDEMMWYIIITILFIEFSGFYVIGNLT